MVVGRGKGGAGSGHCLVDEGFYQSALSLSAHTPCVMTCCRTEEQDAVQHDRWVHGAVWMLM